MQYYLYEIKNNLNGKIYVGVHKTKNLDDGYMGSGKVINSAISKYGIDNFTKTILETFETKEQMFAREREIVTEEFLMREDVYNLRRGGLGGFDYINESGIPKFKDKLHSEETKQKIRLKRIGITHYIPTEETKKKISNSKTGKSTKLKDCPKSEEHKRKISEAMKKRWREKKECG